MSEGLLCKALAILCFVFGVVGKPLSILTTVPNDTPAFVANSMIVSPFSKRISFNVFISATGSQIRQSVMSIIYHSISEGSTCSALLRARRVGKLAFCLRFSKREIVPYPTPETLANSRWLNATFSLTSLSFIEIIVSLQQYFSNDLTTLLS